MDCDHDTEHDWDSVLETRSEMERDAREADVTFLRRDPAIACQWYETPEVFAIPGGGCDYCEPEPEDGGGGRLICTERCDGYQCGIVSAFVVERSDGDKFFGWDGKHESCEVHLVAVIDGMLSGDEKLHAIVSPRWWDGDPADSSLLAAKEGDAQ